MAISIAKEWKSYKRAVLSPTASQIHLDDLKKAFYAGAVSILSTVMQFGEGDEVCERIPVEVNVLNTLMDEAERFATRVANDESDNQRQQETSSNEAHAELKALGSDVHVLVQFVFPRF